MNQNHEKVKEKLNSIISEMEQFHWLYSARPGHDFTRQTLGKLSFGDTMRLILTMGKDSTADELTLDELESSTTLI